VVKEKFSREKRAKYDDKLNTDRQNVVQMRPQSWSLGILPDPPRPNRGGGQSSQRGAQNANRARGGRARAQCGQGAGAAATAVGRASGPLASSNPSFLVKKFNPGDVNVPCPNFGI
jgi:hypothetical protein